MEAQAGQIAEMAKKTPTKKCRTIGNRVQMRKSGIEETRRNIEKKKQEYVEWGDK